MPESLPIIALSDNPMIFAQSHIADTLSIVPLPQHIVL